MHEYVVLFVQVLFYQSTVSKHMNVFLLHKVSHGTLIQVRKLEQRLCRPIKNKEPTTQPPLVSDN